MAELIDQLDPSSTATTLMTAEDRPWNRTHLRVPQADRSLLAVPDLEHVQAAIPRNAEWLDHSDRLVAGQPLGLLRKQARTEAIRAAVEYTQRIAGVSITIPPEQGIIAGGHQPALFHPGVWVKNFALGHLAQSSSRTALHLIVDNDTLSTTALIVPGGGPDCPELESVLFDRPRAPQPWEEARIEDSECFASFADRVERTLSAWDFRPLLADIWSYAAAYRREQSAGAEPALADSLRDALTAVRHRTERRWGLENLELPLSALCETSTFRCFVWHILDHLEDFLHVHNDVLRQYRAVNRLRSQTHPVPELIREGDWLEAPFWIWKRGDSQRNRLFVRRSSTGLELRSGTEVVVRLPSGPDQNAPAALAAIGQLAERGLRLRTRALTTTLFARVMLADLFVHGIGGAKYDEMTDRIVSRFFGIPAPAFLTISATVRLPLAPVADVSEADVLRIRSQLRDLTFNPERYLQDTTTAPLSELLAERRDLIAEQHRAEARRDGAADAGGDTSRSHAARAREKRTGYARYRRLRTLVEELAPYTQPLRAALHSELEHTTEQLQQNAIRLNREYAFCLYPEDKLRAFLTNLSRASD